MHTQETSDGKEELSAGKVLLLCRCLVSRESEGKEPAIVRYMECVPCLDEMHEALRCMRLQWATACSAEKRHDVDGKRENRGAVEAVEWYGATPF